MAVGLLGSRSFSTLGLITTNPTPPAPPPTPGVGNPMGLLLSLTYAS